MCGPFFTRKPLFQNKKFLDDTFFLLSSYFHTHPITITLLLQILGDGYMGRANLKFWGDRLPSPLKSPPMTKTFVATNA